MSPRDHPDTLPPGLAEGAVRVLETAAPLDKARRARDLAAAWRDGELVDVGRAKPPDRPARPAAPRLCPPRELAKRKINRSPEGRRALLHALAHIELNAIDLAVDIVARFTDEDLPRDFYDDWLRVADEEGKHFQLLSARLTSLGGAYGDLPAHDGLWQAARETADDLLARLALVPLVLEARGLDVTPRMIARLEAVEDRESADILKIIYREEIGHVAAGKRWFDYLAKRRALEPRAAWRALVRARYRGRLKPPFNEPARTPADFPLDYYGALEDGD